MHAARYPALRGWFWLKRGFSLWRSAMLPLTGSAMTMVMCLLLALQLPPVGPLLAVFLIFPLQVGMFVVCNSVALGQPPHPRLLFAAFTPTRLPRLLQLTGLWLVTILLCFSLGVFITGLDLQGFMKQLEAATPLSAETVSALNRTALWASLLFLPFNLASFYAAPLIALRQQPVFKALFFSFVACWRNIAALFILMCLFGVLGELLPRLILGSLGGALAVLLAGLWMLVLIPVFCASYHASAREIFGEWPGA